MEKLRRNTLDCLYYSQGSVEVEVPLLGLTLSSHLHQNFDLLVSRA
jgi:hypothetical protein